MGIAPIKDPDPGLSDELNYGWLVADGVIQCKDGSFLGGWVVTGDDSSAWSRSELLHRSETINDAFVRLGGGWSFWHDIVCMRTSEYADPEADYFPDEVTAQIDDERREAFEGDGLFTVERKQVLLFQYTPPSTHTRKAATLLFDDGDAKDRRSPRSIAEEELRHFRAKMAGFETSMYGAAKLERLCDYYADDDGSLCSHIVNYIDFRISGRSREVRLVGDDIYLDGIFAYDHVDTAYPLKFGHDEFILCLTIDGYPPIGHPGILDRMARVAGFEYVWSTRMVMRDRAVSLKDINVAQRNWKTQIKGLAPTILRIKDAKENEDAKDMHADSRDAEKKASSEKVLYGYLTPVIILRGKDIKVLEAQAAFVQKVCSQAKFNARLETFNSMEAWIGSIAGHPVHNVRRPPLNTRNASDLICWSTLWRGPEKHPNPMYRADANPLMYALTEGGEPYRVNFFDTDLGNVILFGPPGSGKTAMLNTVAASEMRYEDMRQWSIDFKYGLYTLAKACGWNHYDLGGGSGLALCPLGKLDEEDDRQAASTWIENRFETRVRSETGVGRIPSPRQSKEINAAIEIMRHLPGKRSLSDFCALVQDYEVRDAIRHFTIDGAAGGILDAEDDTLSSDCNAVFECEEFVQSYDESIISAVYAHLFRKFWRGLRSDRPSALLIDEAHYGYRDKHFSRLLDISLRTIRSKNGHIIMATQSIQEAVENGIGTLLREACPTKILLANSKAAECGDDKYLGPRDYYRMIGATDEDIEIVRRATAKLHYYIIGPQGKANINLALGGKLLDIISTPVIREEIRENA